MQDLQAVARMARDGRVITTRRTACPIVRQGNVSRRGICRDRGDATGVRPGIGRVRTGSVSGAFISCHVGAPYVRAVCLVPAR